MSAPLRTAQARPGCAPDRADAKRRAARAFDGAVRETAASNEAVGAALDLNEKRVRRARSDDAADLDVVPSTADLLLADPALFAAWLARIVAERAAIHGPDGAVTVERALCASLLRDADVQREAALALADGAVTPDEVPALEAALARSHATRDVLAGLLRARGRR